MNGVSRFCLAALATLTGPVLASAAEAQPPPRTFVPATAEGPVAASDSADLPCGARAFEVDLPRPESALVLDAADYGVNAASADNTAALRTAFAEAKARRAARLTLAPGVYRLTGDAPLTLEDFSDFTFDARGVTFVTHRKEGSFLHLARCVRTRLVGFTLDWDWAREPLASLVQVVRRGDDFFDFAFVDYADFPAKEALQGLLHFTTWDAKLRVPGLEGAYGRECSAAAKRTWLDGRTIRVFERPWAMAPGQVYRLQHYYYHMGGISMDANEHLRLEDVTVKSTPGHAFHMRGTQRHTLFARVNIAAPRDDPRRVITCTADHLHVAASRGFIKMEDCLFSLGEDDFVNVHDNTSFARRRSQKVLRATSRFYGSLPKGTRVEVRNADYSETGFTGTVVGVTRAPDGESGFDIAFAEDVPPETKGGFVLFDRTYDTRNVIIRNCRFIGNRARGILVLARDVTIEGNAFRHTGSGAIQVETGYTRDKWSEGYGVSNVVIRGNLFDNANPVGARAPQLQPVIYAGVYRPKDIDAPVGYPILRDILIERNVFRDSYGVAAYLSNVQDVTVRDNLLADARPRLKDPPCRAQFHLVRAKDVRVVNNVWRPSPHVAAPGVAWDPASCTGVVAEGNRVKEKDARP